MFMVSCSWTIINAAAVKGFLEVLWRGCILVVVILAGEDACGRMDHKTLGASQGAAKSEGIESYRKIQQASWEERSEMNQGQGGKSVTADVAPAHEKSHGDVNMEADITMDGVIRAGGLGARNDLNSVLPVAADNTDFEAPIRDAWDYEGQRESIT